MRQRSPPRLHHPLVQVRAIRLCPAVCTDPNCAADRHKIEPKTALRARPLPAKWPGSQRRRRGKEGKEGDQEACRRRKGQRGGANRQGRDGKREMVIVADGKKGTMEKVKAGDRDWEDVG